jgi:hypothetical protein
MTVNDHFYTTSTSEQDHAIAHLGYTSEGIACYTFDTQQSNTLPLYRLVKDTHFYTTSASERDTAVAAGYQSEGTACYVSAGPTGTVPFYRLVKDGHFYTTSLPERDNAISAFGYASEDIACYVFSSQSSGTVPLYRLLKGSDHFYTTSASERAHAIANLGYQSEGTACYTFETRQNGTVPLYRLLKDTHFYTISASERDQAIANLGYQSEGTACYVSAGPTGTVPFYRLVKDGHFYTTSLPERDNAISAFGYASEDIACYVCGSQSSGTVPLYRLRGVDTIVKTSFRPDPDGYNFANSWHFDQVEKDTIIELVHEATVPAMSALSPLLAPAFGLVDAIGLLFGIPPGVVETAGIIAVVSGGLDNWIKGLLPEIYKLCGGMAFSALDYYKLGIPINRVDHVPERTTPTLIALRDYIWSRLIDSLLAGVAATTLEWMALLHLVPESFGGGSHELLVRSRREWEKLKSHLNAGEPWPVGLIGTTTNPMDNHQVLAYGYEEKEDGSCILWIYDNNHPNEEVSIQLNFSGNELGAIESEPSSGRGPLKGFFTEPYSLKTPPQTIFTHFYTISASERDHAVANLGYQSEGTACYVSAGPTGTVPFYRLVKDGHFYTTSLPERDNAISAFGYASEDIACYVFSSQSSGTVPLYRLLKGNDHFYTTSASERDHAIANLGYQSEGTACYTFETRQNGTVPLYRLLKDTHFYTISASERDTAVAAGYQSEGTACYVSAGPTGTVPFYRLVKDGHFYTTSLPERDNAISAFGYASEDIACYVFSSQSSGTVPLYRLLKGNDHFYTTSASERDHAIANLGYQSEGTACYTFETRQNDTVPLYRLVGQT